MDFSLKHIWCRLIYCVKHLLNKRWFVNVQKGSFLARSERRQGDVELVAGVIRWNNT
jgi:hypothetical protein